jgi:hypothetical protein
MEYLLPSFQNLLSVNLLSKNIIIKIYRNLPVLCGLKVLSVILSEEHSLRACKNRVLMKIFGPKEGDGTRDWR